MNKGCKLKDYDSVLIDNILIISILYLSQPVVVAEFEQAREEDFTFSRPHKLLPLPHVLLQQILLT